MSKAAEILKTRSAEAERNRLALPDHKRVVDISECPEKSQDGVSRGELSDYEVSADKMVLFVNGKEVVWK